LSSTADPIEKSWFCGRLASGWRAAGDEARAEAFDRLSQRLARG
jgi:hypothetical protein